MPYLYIVQTWPVCNIVLPATHTRTIPAFTPQRQGVTTLWLVLTAPTHEGMDRLSWPGWLVTYGIRFRAPGTEPGHGHPSQY